MGNARQHLISNLGTTVGLVVGASTSGLDPLSTIAMAAGCLSGNVLTPDLDLAENKARRLDPVGLFFLPYGLLFKHRSFLSHAPIIGTAIRLAYVIMPVALFLAAISRLDILTWIFHQPLAWRLVMGLAVADLDHLVLDLSGVYRSKSNRKSSQKVRSYHRKR